MPRPMRMWSRDAVARALGMERVEVTPAAPRRGGMRVRPDMANGHHICHGGMIFTLADTAFAYARQQLQPGTPWASPAPDRLPQVPGREGDLLEAQAIERGGRPHRCL